MRAPHHTDDTSLRVTRRTFVRTAAVAVAAIGTGGAASFAPARARGAPPKGVTRYPLRPLTTVLKPTDFTLTEAPAQLDLGSGLSNVLAYNGSFPGPTFVANRGDPVSFHLVNGLTEETITHWHGMLVDPANDGGPKLAIPPGRSYDYGFTVNQRACLNWYHPHPHMLTGEQVNLGLAGAFVVRDAEERNLNLPQADHEVPLIIRDATLDKAGNLDYRPRTGGFDGQIPLVNGTLSPYLAVNQGVYRLRILNGANARIFGLALSNGAAFRLIGNDGGFLDAWSDEPRIDIAPAERLDVLVSFAGVPGGQSVMLRDLRAGWDLLEFRVGAGGAAALPTPSFTPVTKLANPVTTRTFSFDGMSKINGKLFDLNRIDFTVPFGQVERWRLVTNGNAPHPVHVHGASFQVQSRTGGRGKVYPWERGWKDTVLLDDNETVEVLIRFDTFRGLYLIHCHKLEHEDMGMMANFEVV